MSLCRAGSIMLSDALKQLHVLMLRKRGRWGWGWYVGLKEGRGVGGCLGVWGDANAEFDLC